MNVIKTLVSAPAWLVILAYSVRTVRMDSLPTVPAAVWPAHVTLLERCTFSVTGQLFPDSHVVLITHWNFPMTMLQSPTFFL